MSQRTKFDRRLKDFMIRSANRIETLEFESEQATAHKLLALQDLILGQEILEPAVVTALKEDFDVYLASEAGRLAENVVENAYEPLRLSLDQIKIKKTLKNPEDGEAFTKKMEEVGAAMPPSTFRALGLDQTLSVGEAMVKFAESHLEGDNPYLVKMSGAIDELGQARTRIDKEEGEETNATIALKEARDQARALYAAARDALRGGLRIERHPDPLRKFMPSLRKIYNQSTTQDSDDADVDPSTPNPPTQPDPQNT